MDKQPSNTNVPLQQPQFNGPLSRAGWVSPKFRKEAAATMPKGQYNKIKAEARREQSREW